MTYRQDDEREFLISFMEWLAARLIHPDGARIIVSGETNLVTEFLKEREEQRSWGGFAQKHQF